MKKIRIKKCSVPHSTRTVRGGSSSFSEVVAGGQHHDIQLRRAGRVWQVSPRNILVATDHALSFTSNYEVDSDRMFRLTYDVQLQLLAARRKVLLGIQSAMGRNSRLPTCWLAQVDERLSTYNLCIDNDQLPPCARLKQLAERQYIVHHQVAAADSNRVRAYLGLNSSAQYGYKEYLSRVDNAQLRRSLAHFRCANHKLQIELGRQVKPVKVPVQQRYCKLCNLGAVEDEDHFSMVCPAYQSVRKRFIGSLPLTAITPLAELLNCQQQGILARFLVQCQMVRSELLHQT